MPVPAPSDMPSYMLNDVLQILLGDVAMWLCFFAPGYLTAASTDLMGFRRRSLAEKILWSIALSGPVSILLTCIVARVLPQAAMLVIFPVAGAFALFFFGRDFLRAQQQRVLNFDRSFWLVTAAMAAVAVYCIAATVGIQTQHSLHESIVAADWSVRVPLVEAAVRGGLPPLNPMFAAAGHAPPMRYYYFWYEICALIVRLTHIPARAALTATCAWAAYTVMSVLFLTIKYMGRTTTLPRFWMNETTETTVPGATLRRICVVATGLTCVMGLDLIVAVRDALAKPAVIFPDIEAWRGDRMPSWVGAILFAPHHVAGVAFGSLGFLLLAVLPAQRRQQMVHALLAAICFAALVGTSTYLSICFAIAGLVLVLLRLRQRQWAGLATIALCAVAAVAMALPFLREMSANTGLSAAEHARPGAAHALLGNGMFAVVLSNWHAAYGSVGSFSSNHGLHLDRGHFRYLWPIFALPYWFLMELTFFVFVIWYQAKADFFERPIARPVTERAMMLWALFIGFALPGLFLSSEPVQGINDLERHCGLALRLVLIAWAAPMFANVRLKLRAGAIPSRAGSSVIALTAMMVVIGLGGELWQVTMDRLYFPLISHGLVRSKVWFGRGAPFLQIRRANDVINANFPAGAIIQGNPESPYDALFLLYGKRQVAAGDESCEAAFGGNVDLCKAEVVKPLHALFGGTIDHRKYDPGEVLPEPADPANMTAARFAATCASLHLSVVLASKDDAAWGIPGTWVYTEPTLYADDATRVISCPR
jgi:hypothetical protein